MNRSTKVKHIARLVTEFDRIDPQSCRLTDGSVIGELFVRDGTVYLEPREYSGNVYLFLDVLEYRDFNQDG